MILASLRRAGPALGAVLVAMTSACQQADKPAAPAVAAAPAVLAPPPAEPRRPPARRVVSLAWSFGFGPDQCVATATGDFATLTVTVRRSATVDVMLAVAPPPPARGAARAPASLRFSGPSGQWSLPASGTAQHGFAASSEADERALGRVLILLGGGTLDVTSAPPGVPTVQLPPGGPQGQTWSDCARRQII